MKNTKCRIFVFLLTVSSLFGYLSAAEVGAYDQFNAPINTAWGTDVSDVYEIKVENGATVISSTDAGGSGNYHSFSYTFPEPVDISAAPYLSVKIKAWWNPVVRIDVQDVNGLSSSEYPETFELSKDGRFNRYEGNYTDATHWEAGQYVDLTKIEKIVFMINANETYEYSGGIEIDDLMLGDVILDFVTEDFSDGSLDHAWVNYVPTGTPPYTLVEDPDDENLQVTVDPTGTGSYFGYTFHFTDLTDDATVSFDLQCADNVNLIINLADGHDNFSIRSNDYTLSHTGSTSVESYTVDLSAYATSTLKKSAMMVTFQVDDNTFDGTFTLDNLRVGSDPGTVANQAPVIARIGDQKVKVGEDFPPIDLTEYITDLEGDIYTVAVFGQIELDAVITPDTVLFVIAPAPDWIGSETLTVDVQDSEGNTNSATLTFTVEDIFPTGHYNNFSSVIQGSWETGNAKYAATVENGMSKLTVDNAGGLNAFDATAYVFDKPVNMESKHDLSMRIKTDDEIEIRVQLEDAHGNASSFEYFNTAADGLFDTYRYLGIVSQRDLSGDPADYDFDFSNVTKIVVFVNSNLDPAYSGDVYFDDILVGDYRTSYLFEDFDDNQVNGDWYFASEYTNPTETGSDLTFTADLAAGQYEAIAFNFVTMDLSSNPYVNITLKSDSDVEIRLDLDNGAGLSTNKSPIVKTLKGDGFYHNLTYDFTGLFETNTGAVVNSSEIKTVLLMVNPGGDPSSANISIDKLEVGKKGIEMGNQPPSIADIPKVSMITGDNPAVVKLSDYITDDNTAFADLTFSVTGTAEIGAAISGGELTVSILEAGWTGVTTIPLTVEDADGETSEYDITVRVTDGSINPYGYAEYFDGMTDVEVITESEELKLSIANEELVVAATNAGGDGNYTALTIEFPYAVDLTNNRELAITVNAPVEYTMRMDLVDANGVVGNSQQSHLLGFYETAGVTHTITTEFDEYQYDLDGNNLDITKIQGIVLYFNADISTTITGTITIDDLIIGNQSGGQNLAPQMKDGIEVAILSGQKSEQIDLNEYVQDETPDNQLTWDVSAETLFDITITDGVATIQPDYTAWVDPEEVIFTVKDAEGETGTVTFTLVLSQGDQAPVIAEIPSQTIFSNELFENIKLDSYVTDETPDAHIVWTWSTPTNLQVTPFGRDVVIDFTPGWTGAERIMFTAKDETGKTSSVEVEFTVVSVNENQAPVITPVEDQTIAFRMTDFPTISLDEIVEDETADENIQWSVEGNVDLEVSLSLRDLNVSTPSHDWTGSETLTLTARDELDKTTSIEIIFTVLDDSNTAPVLSLIPNQTTDQGVAFENFDLNGYATDAETATAYLAWQVHGMRNLEASITDGILTVAVLSASWTGTETLEVVVIDQGGLEDRQEVDFTVEEVVVNQAPVLSAIAGQTIAVGESFTHVDLGMYVTDETAFEDLVWTVSSGPYLIGNVEAGLFSVIALDTEWTGSQEINLIAKDEEGLTSSVAIEYTVIAVNVNQAPVVSTIPKQEISQGEIFTALDLSLYVSDETPALDIVWTVASSTKLTAAVVAGMLNVSVKDADWYGTEILTLTAKDAEGLTSDLGVIYSVAQVVTNEAPVITAIPNQTINEGGTFTSITLDDFVKDETADADIVWSTSAAEKFTISIQNNLASITVTDPKRLGAETVTFTATDTEGLSSSVEVEFTVLQSGDTEPPVVDPVTPVLVDNGLDFPEIDLNELVDSNTDADDLTISVAGPAELTLTLTDGILMVEPVDQNWSGEADITITVTDMAGNEATTTLSVKRNAQDENSAPVFADISVTDPVSDGMFRLDFSEYVSDEDIASVTYSVDAGNDVKILQSGSIIVIQPLSDNYSGTVPVTVTATDSEGQETVKTFDVTFTATSVYTNHISISAKVYPNPVSEILFIESLLQVNTNVVLLNSNGITVSSIETNEGEVSIDVSTLPSGVYTLRVDTESGEYIELIMID